MNGVYYKKLLKELVYPWIQRGEDFVLEEDKDRLYHSKVVLNYKKEIGLDYYINCKGSPDLSVIETCAGVSKARFRKTPRLTKEDIRQEAIES